MENIPQEVQQKLQNLANDQIVLEHGIKLEKIEKRFAEVLPNAKEIFPNEIAKMYNYAYQIVMSEVINQTQMTIPMFVVDFFVMTNNGSRSLQDGTVRGDAIVMARPISKDPSKPYELKFGIITVRGAECSKLLLLKPLFVYRAKLGFRKDSQPEDSYSFSIEQQTDGFEQINLDGIPASEEDRVKLIQAQFPEVKLMEMEKTDEKGVPTNLSQVITQTYKTGKTSKPFVDPLDLKRVRGIVTSCMKLRANGVDSAGVYNIIPEDVDILPSQLRPKVVAGKTIRGDFSVWCPATLMLHGAGSYLEFTGVTVRAKDTGAVSMRAGLITIPDKRRVKPYVEKASQKLESGTGSKLMVDLSAIDKQ